MNTPTSPDTDEDRREPSTPNSRRNPFAAAFAAVAGWFRARWHAAYVKRCRKTFARSMLPTSTVPLAANFTRTPNPYLAAPLHGLERVIGRTTDGRSRLGALTGAYTSRVEPLVGTSFNVEVVNPFVADPDLGTNGTLVGLVEPGNAPLIFDAAESYEPGMVGNTFVWGDTNGGKSSYLKVSVLRAIRIGRKAMVIDSKPLRMFDTEKGQWVYRGEWTPIARQAECQSIRMTRNGGVRISPLDRRITRATSSEGDVNENADTTIGQEALLQSIVATALEAPLTGEMRYALTCAHDAAHAAVAARNAASHTDLDPEIADVSHAIQNPSQADAERMGLTIEELRQWGRPVALVLARLDTGDLSGIANGQTSLDFDPNAPLIHIDISDLDAEGVQLPITMAILAAFMRNYWIKSDDTVRLIVVDEAWHIISNPFVARLFRRLWKFWRSLGIIGMAAAHRPDDLPNRTELGSEARALLKESGVLVAFPLSEPEDRAEVAKLFNLTAASEAALGTNPAGTAIIKIGAHPERRVPIMRSSWEKDSTNTDAAFKPHTNAHPDAQKAAA